MVVEYKPIETRYKGYRFRSRLEARWAVFFDHMDIPYEYEKEGLSLPSGGYLPDFWLPSFRSWCEIKPGATPKEDLARYIEVAPTTGHTLMLIEGSPWPGEYVMGYMGDTVSESWPVQAEFAECINCCGVWVVDDEVGAFMFGEHNCCRDGWKFRFRGYLKAAYSDRLKEAFAAARGARFEHGETPQLSETNGA